MSNHSHLNPKGKPKKSYPTKEAAEAHRLNHQRTLHSQGIPHRVSSYKCPQCNMWHVGRTPGPSAEWLAKKRARKHEENMVGILVHTLRLILDK
jgi:hypothetical protein